MEWDGSDGKLAINKLGSNVSFALLFYEVIGQGQVNYVFGGFEEFMENIAEYEKKKKAEEWDRDRLKQYTSSEKWYNIIDKCIRYNPEDRYQQVSDIIQDLGFEHHEPRKQYNITPTTEWMLKVQNGEEIGRMYNLTRLAKFKGKNLLSIGWFNEDDPFTNDIGITEFFTQYISNYHASLQYDPRNYRWEIKDGQFRMKNGTQGWFLSTNGVLVNGTRIYQEGTQLHPEDIITIGDTTLKVMIDEMVE